MQVQKIENAKRKVGYAYPTFFEHVIDLTKIKPLAKKFIVMHSKDDTSIPFWQGEEIAKDLNSEFFQYEGLDHFSEPVCAPFVLTKLREELNF